MSQGWNFFTLLKWGVLPLFCGEKVGVQRPTWGACWKTSVLEIRNLGAKHIERFIRWRNPETLKPFPKICGETIKSDYNLMIFLAVGYTLPPWDGSEADPSSTDWAQPTRVLGLEDWGILSEWDFAGLLDVNHCPKSVSYFWLKTWIQVVFWGLVFHFDLKSGKDFTNLTIFQMGLKRTTSIWQDPVVNGSLPFFIDFP